VNFPLLIDGQRFQDEDMLTASSTGTALSNSGSANTKGSYTQLVASTPYDAQGLLVCLTTNAVAAGQSYLIDIAIGGAGSEQVIIPNILVDPSGATGELGIAAYFPIPIPAGSRIAARQQNSTTTGALRVGVVLMAGGFFGMPLGGRCSDLGTDTSTSGGALIDPGTSANTKGSYTQLVAATAHDIKLLGLAITDNKDTSRSSTTWLVDLAIGGAGSEQVVIPNLLVSSVSSRNMRPAWIGPFPFSIPSGSRVAVRAQSTSVTATRRIIAVAAYGIG